VRVGGTPRSGGYPRSRNVRGVSRFNLQRYEGTKVPSKVKVTKVRRYEGTFEVPSFEVPSYLRMATILLH